MPKKGELKRKDNLEEITCETLANVVPKKVPYGGPVVHVDDAQEGNNHGEQQVNEERLADSHSVYCVLPMQGALKGDKQSMSCVSLIPGFIICAWWSSIHNSLLIVP